MVRITYGLAACPMPPMMKDELGAPMFKAVSKETSGMNERRCALREQQLKRRQYLDKLITSSFHNASFVEEPWHERMPYPFQRPDGARPAGDFDRIQAGSRRRHKGSGLVDTVVRFGDQQVLQWISQHQESTASTSPWHSSATIYRLVKVRIGASGITAESIGKQLEKEERVAR